MATVQLRMEDALEAEKSAKEMGVSRKRNGMDKAHEEV